MLSTEMINSESRWINVTDPVTSEQHELVDRYKVTQEMLNYAIDPFEKARVEIDPNEDIILLIFDVYVPDSEASAPQTAPIGIMLTSNDLITFITGETAFVEPIIAKKLKTIKSERGDKLDLILAVLYQLSVDYLEPLRNIDTQRRNIQDNIRRRTGRRVISESMEIETELVYILTSLKGNISLLEELKRRFGDSMTLKQRDDLDDITVEAQQGLEMAQMTSDVAERVSEAYTKVLDSDLNQTMKFLTVFSIVLSIPTIVSGFYGENVRLPLANSPYAWQLTILITLILMVITIVFVLNRRWWH